MTKLTGFPTVLLLAGTALTLPGGLTAQECRLEPGAATSSAQSALEDAREATDPERATAKYREALEAVAGELRRESRDPAVYIMAAQAEIGLGEYVEADRHLTTFVELAPECDEQAGNVRYNAWVGLYTEAIEAYQEGDADMALERFETANMIHPDPRSFRNAALLYQERGENAKAIKLFRTALEEAPPEESMDLRIDLADALVAEGQAEEAETLYAEILEAEAGALTDAQWNRVGVGMFNASRYDEAASAFENAHRVNRFNKEGLENLVAALIQAQEPARAIPHAETLIERHPYDEGNYQLLGRALVTIGKDVRAMEVMARLEGMPIVFESVQMASFSERRYVVQGVARAEESGAGTTVTVPFEFVDADGEVVATERVSIELPGAGETTGFRLEVSSDQEIVGFRYRTAGSSGIQG